MPEGDSIFRHAALLAPRFGGQVVSGLYARGLAYPTLVGETIGTIEARGKHLLIPIGTRAVVHVHLGMNGRLRVVPTAEWTTLGAARATLAMRAGSLAAFWTRARTVEILRAAFAHTHPGLAALGPSLLERDFAIDEILRRARTRPPATSLGELLLDQRVAAGIGNVYKCEVLFLEQTDPWTPLDGVDDATLARIYEHARALMRRNLGRGPRVTTGSLGGRRYHIYRRVNQPCPRCGTPIAARPQGDPPRTTYFCPRCQARRSPPEPTATKG